MAPAAIAIGAIGTGLDLIGGIEESTSEEKQLLREQAERREQAKDVREAAKVEERNFRIVARKQMGNLTANLAARGVSIKGSGADVLAESARSAEMDSQQIRINADKKARALERGAAGFGAAARDVAGARPLRALGALAGGGAQLLKRTG